MNGLRVLTTLAAALALAACTTVGPDYRVPADAAVHHAAAQAGFQEGRGTTAVSVDPLPAHWWRLYQSPELDALVEQALA